MSEGARVARVSLRAGGGALVVEVVDDQGRTGATEAADGAEIRSAAAQLAGGLVGDRVLATRARWDGRPRESGPRWIAFSALDSAARILAAAAVGRSVAAMLGGQVGSRVPRSPPLEVEALDASQLSFDETAAQVIARRPAAVLLDPRRWGVTAAARLDSLCRALQVSIGFRCESAGPLALDLARALGSALPMATLGIVGAAPEPVSLDVWLAAREPVARFGTG